MIRPGLRLEGYRGGEAKAEYCKVYSSLFFLSFYGNLLMTYSVDTCTGLLPDSKPRYVMGVVSLASCTQKNEYS